MKRFSKGTVEKLEYPASVLWEIGNLIYDHGTWTTSKDLPTMEKVIDTFIRWRMSEFSPYQAPGCVETSSGSLDDNGGFLIA